MLFYKEHNSDPARISHLNGRIVQTLGSLLLYEKPCFALVPSVTSTSGKHDLHGLGTSDGLAGMEAEWRPGEDRVTAESSLREGGETSCQALLLMEASHYPFPTPGDNQQLLGGPLVNYPKREKTQNSQGCSLQKTGSWFEKRVFPGASS